MAVKINVNRRDRENESAFRGNILFWFYNRISVSVVCGSFNLQQNVSLSRLNQDSTLCIQLKRF
jgi:hypothetical protein